ncbi:MAG: aldehyde dehydrogenase family protein [Candidatus Brocadiia bacterium]
MTERISFVLGGKPEFRPQTFEVRNPADSTVWASVSTPTADDINRAVELARVGAATVAAMSGRKRAEILRGTARILLDRCELFAETIRRESGKPISLARHEARRAASLFELASAQMDRWGGDFIPFDGVEGGEGKWGVILRVPRGVILGITPFNFPLNLVAHKLAPAFASGNALIVKPSRSTPVSAIRLVEAMVEAGAPPEAFSVLTISGEQAEELATRPEVKMVTFTGGAKVGWRLKKAAFDKPVTLELGGNAAAIIGNIKDLAGVAQRVARAGVVNAGQVCISVQRVYAVEAIYDEFRDLLTAAVKAAKWGDTSDPEVIVGPMINESAAKRVSDWVKDASDSGARVLCGGRRQGNYFEPTLIENPPLTSKVHCEEVFAPVLTITKVADVNEAVKLTNASDYGLQAGIFTESLDEALSAARVLEVGGVIINDVPTYRSDHMPYGGVKKSGNGKEGVLYAMEEMTEQRIVVFSPSQKKG